MKRKSGFIIIDADYNTLELTTLETYAFMKDIGFNYVDRIRKHRTKKEMYDDINKWYRGEPE